MNGDNVKGGSVIWRRMMGNHGASEKKSSCAESGLPLNELTAEAVRTEVKSLFQN